MIKIQKLNACNGNEILNYKEETIASIMSSEE